jgi:1,3-beta-glucanosyltransferase GAS5
MKMLDDAGIYLAVDVNSPLYSLNRKDPRTSYNDVYLQNVFATMEEFAQYDNTLLFFSGNEIINSPSTTLTAPYIKAVVRDMKEYRDKQNLREIPIGYSAADVSQNRVQTAEYLNCGDDAARSEFFAFNDYSWCDPSDFQTSGWDQKVETFKSYSIPLFLSEYGCITNTRKWEEVASLYDPTEMTAVYSGGLAFEYSEEGDGFGLVTINGNSVSPKPDFTALVSAFKKTPAPSGSAGAHSGAASKCPPKTSQWEVDTEALPPIPAPAKKFMTEGVTKGFGLNGAGSQTAGTPSTGLPGEDSGSGGSGTSGGEGSSTSPSDTPGAAANVQIPQLSLVAPAVVGLAVMASSLFGASLL